MLDPVPVERHVRLATRTYLTQKQQAVVSSTHAKDQLLEVRVQVLAVTIGDLRHRRVWLVGIGPVETLAGGVHMQPTAVRLVAQNDLPHHGTQHFLRIGLPQVVQDSSGPGIVELLGSQVWPPWLLTG